MALTKILTDGTETGLTVAQKVNAAIDEVDLNTAKITYPSGDATKLSGIEPLADVTANNETSHADVLVDGDINVTVQEFPTYNAQVGLTYTAVLTDAEKIISMDNALANTLTIPANASVAYPIGTKLNFLQLGAGATTIAITTDTLNVNANLTPVLNGQYAIATALKVTATSWVLFGNLGAV